MASENYAVIKVHQAHSKQQERSSSKGELASSFSYLFTAPAAWGVKSNLASKNALGREKRKHPLKQR